MERYELDGVNYYYRNGKWYDEERKAVPLALTSRLNRLILNQEELQDKSLNELLTIADGAKQSGNLLLAAKALEEALDIATLQELKWVLPRMTAYYRKAGFPQKAIDLDKEYTEKYGKKVWSPALFTSIAAAYCDLNDMDTAKKFANLARQLGGGECGEELKLVYSRIKRNS